MGEIDFLKRKKELPRRRSFSIEYTRPAKEPPPPSRKIMKNAKEEIKEIRAPKNNRDYRKPTPTVLPPESKESLIDINLLRKKNGQRVITFSKVALAGLIFVMLVYLGLVWWQASQVASVKITQTKIRELDEKILAFRPWQEKVNDFASQLNASLEAWDKHIYWTKFFTELEKYTLPETSYTNFSGNINGTIALQAETSSLAAVSRQLQVFESAFWVKEAEVSNISQELNEETGARTVRYNLSLMIQEDVLY